MKTYNIGDWVWVANFGSEQVRVPCPVCYGNKEVIVILGNGDEVATECGYCCRGFSGSTGYVTEYQYIPDVEHIEITGKQVQETRNGTVIEYDHLISGEYGSSHSRKLLVDIFDTEEEAYQKAVEQAEAYQKAQDDKVKFKNEKSYSWNAGYHLKKVQDAERELKYHAEKARVCKTKSRNKEE